MKDKVLLYSAIQTPDGTVLVSRNRHDYVTHTDKNGEWYMLDGGDDYIKGSVNKEQPKSLALYSDDPHEKLREVITRGGRGINGDEPLTYVVLKDISDEWLEAIIKYEEENRPHNKFLPVYRNEVKFRKK